MSRFNPFAVLTVIYLLIAALIFLGGCATNTPYYIECKGKGSVTGTGVAPFALQADCGDGLSLTKTSAPPAAQTQAPPK